MNKVLIIKRQINTIDAMTLTELKDKFLELNGFASGQTSPRNLRMRLAYRIQELYLGGVSDDDLKRINAIADDDPLANLRAIGTKAGMPHLKGTRYERDWKGKTYQVTVIGNGTYEFGGVIYKSLSAIASKITGTHWNGKKFFGVK